MNLILYDYKLRSQSKGDKTIYEREREHHFADFSSFSIMRLKKKKIPNSKWMLMISLHTEIVKIVKT